MPKRDAAYMERRRHQILDAATACLLRTGLGGLSTSAICEEAGISTGALYTHFRSKAAILQALAERSAERRRDTLTGRDAGGLKSVLRRLLKDEQSDAGMAVSRIDLQLLSWRGDEDELAEVVLALKENDDFLQALRALRGNGQLRPGVSPETAAAALEAFLMGVKVLTLMGQKHGPALGEALELVLAAVLANAGD